MRLSRNSAEDSSARFWCRLGPPEAVRVLGRCGGRLGGVQAARCDNPDPGARECAFRPPRAAVVTHPAEAARVWASEPVVGEGVGEGEVRRIVGSPACMHRSLAVDRRAAEPGRERAPAEHRGDSPSPCGASVWMAVHPARSSATASYDRFPHPGLGGPGAGAPGEPNRPGRPTRPGEPNQRARANQSASRQPGPRQRLGRRAGVLHEPPDGHRRQMLGAQGLDE
jgi:hypothetical protein